MSANEEISVSESDGVANQEVHAKRHKMVVVKYNDEEAYVDEGIAPLIEELWKAGIHTVMSCDENRPGWMWIEFRSSEYAEKFEHCRSL